MKSQQILPIFLKLTLILGVSPICTGQQVEENDPSIISKEAKLELLNDGFTNLEGSSVSPDGRVFFVDLIHTRLDSLGPAKIMSYDPESGEFSIFSSPSGRTAGTEFDINGELICAEFTDGGGRRITKRNIYSREARFLATGYNDKPFNGPNDLTIDKKNRIYLTDYPYTIGTETLYHRFGVVYRIDLNGTVTQIIENAGMPNGIVISPDQKTLYVGTNGYDIWKKQAILAYDLSPEGEVSFRSIFVDFGTTSGTPDGMTVDFNGNLYVGIVRGSIGTGVKVYSPSGEELAFIKTPTRVQNVAFGRGKHNRTLFIVGGSSIYKIELEVEGYHLSQKGLNK